MVDEVKKTAIFNISETGSTPPGTKALDFYTSFARPGTLQYTWNKSMGNSLDALKNGKTLMALGYFGDLNRLGPPDQSRIAVAAVPQSDPNNPKTYGRYFVAGVTKQVEAEKKDKLNAAWDFVSLLANPAISEQYALDLRQVPARKDLMSRLTLGPQYDAFLTQVPTPTRLVKASFGIAMERR
jgi:ABC-type glycerol-3-phosphate transport system substrate-binding protein